jgi:secreted trypsin-like serine protease
MTRTSLRRGRRPPRLALALAALPALAVVLLAVAPRASAAPFSPRVFGGNDATITDVPYQVALVAHGASAATSQFCGGSVRDATHVITAAHCVEDLSTRQVVPADALDVLAGTANLGSGGQRRAVAAVTVHPDFDPDWMTYDAALLTLAEPLTLDTTVQPVTLVDDLLWAATPPERALRLSGWGRTETTTRPLVLQTATLPLKSDPFCDAQYGGLLTTELMLCAGDGVHDSCNGDSGGPLALNAGSSAAPAWRLVGIVSFGGQTGCGSDTQYGVYTEVAAPRIRAFLLSGTAPPATPETPATTPQSSGQATPATTSTPAPSPAPAVTTPAQSDTVAPVATVTRAACTRTRCVLDLRVVDAGFSRGVRSVDATVVSTYRARCRRGGRTRSCTRTRTRRLRATRTSAGRYRVVASSLPAGRHVVTVRATDSSGNRQIVAARRALRTPSRR